MDITKEKKIRRLVIKTFHIKKVAFGNKFKLMGNNLIISTNMLDKLITREELLKEIGVEIIRPGEHDRWTNSIMDIIPISTKVLGDIGEGITHTLTGVYIILTGVDETGEQMSDFGSSAGNLKDKIYLNRAGTPAENDFIISFNVTLKEGAGKERLGPIAVHRVCDQFIQEIRDELKKCNSGLYSEKHVFYDRVKFDRKKVAIVKQVAGQGTMYDNLLFPQEPSGFKGGKSIIDLGNIPVILTPNEYRDGAIRAMT